MAKKKRCTSGYKRVLKRTKGYTNSNGTRVKSYVRSVCVPKKRVATAPVRRRRKRSAPVAKPSVCARGKRQYPVEFYSKKNKQFTRRVCLSRKKLKDEYERVDRNGDVPAFYRKRNQLLLTAPPQSSSAPLISLPPQSSSTPLMSFPSPPPPQSSSTPLIPSFPPPPPPQSSSTPLIPSFPPPPPPQSSSTPLMPSFTPPPPPPAQPPSAPSSPTRSFGLPLTGGGFGMFNIFPDSG